jgi:hypothetical protein
LPETGGGKEVVCKDNSCFGNNPCAVQLMNRSRKCQWLMPVILATQEAEIRRFVVQSQPWEIVLETLSRKNPSQKRADGVAQSVGPKFKPQYHKQNKTEKKKGRKEGRKDGRKEGKGKKERKKKKKYGIYIYIHNGVLLS